jgi:hypothetical protein
MSDDPYTFFYMKNAFDNDALCHNQSAFNKMAQNFYASAFPPSEQQAVRCRSDLYWAALSLFLFVLLPSLVVWFTCGKRFVEYVIREHKGLKPPLALAGVSKRKRVKKKTLNIERSRSSKRKQITLRVL